MSLSLKQIITFKDNGVPIFQGYKLINLLTMSVMYGAAKVTAAAISPATLVPVPRTLVGIISVAWTHITYQPTLEESLEHNFYFMDSLSSFCYNF